MVVKNALVAADMLNDKVLPFYQEQEIDLLRILTDRGTDGAARRYCGAKEQHEYQLYLNIEDIDHTRTKAKSPQTNGICERFHRTMQPGGPVPRSFTLLPSGRKSMRTW